MDDKTLDIIDHTIDVIFLTLIMLQKITNKSQNEILDMIKVEGQKTDELLKKLK